MIIAKTVMIPTSRRKKKMMTPLVILSVSIIASLLPLWLGPSFRFLPAVEAGSAPQKKSPLPVVPYDGNINSGGDDKALSSLLGELDSFVSDAVSYLVRISHTAEQDPKFPGRFTYQADIRKKLDPRSNYWNHHQQPDYNLLRHNGAIYALSQAYHRNEEKRKNTSNNNDASKRSFDANQIAIQHTIENAVGYLRDNALLPVPGHKDEWLAAWERNDPEDPHSEPDTAKLGGAGLAMIALGKLEEIKPHSVSHEKELRKLGAFVESLQNKEDGSFTCKYKWGIGPYDKWKSLYYPGEAALGLVTLAELELKIEEEEGRSQRKMVTSAELELEHQHHNTDHISSNNEKEEKYSQRWIKVATNALLYLEQLRRDQDLEEIEPDHWALLATARLLPILDQLKQDLTDDSIERKQADLEYWLVYNHGTRVANAMVSDHTTEGLSKHGGCFTYDARTCPTATRLEGLLAAMTFIQESEVFFGGESDATELLKDRIERDVGTGIRFLLQAQQKTDRNGMRGAVPGKFTGRKPAALPASSAESSNDESEDEQNDKDFHLAEVRVDYVQHSMSAVMAYETFLLDEMEKRHEQMAFHEKVHQVVHHAVRHVKHKIDTATASSAFVNYVILGAVCLLVTVVMTLVYLPSSWIPFSARHYRRRRRVKRKD